MTKKKVGRPSKFTKLVVDTICNRLAEGESLRSICKDKDMPTSETVRVWLRDDAAFSLQYARAREEQADTHVDDMLQITDDPEIDPQDKRVRIDARKWIAGKMRPKVYGDKITTEHEGTINLKLEDLSDDELKAKLKALE